MVIEMQGADPGWPLTDRLRRAREFGGFDQAQLAAELGVSKNTISNYERGFTRPRRPMLLAWAMATGVALTWLETDDASKLEIVRPKGFEPLTFWFGVCEHELGLAA
jgi:transcriptional regulator with XRE-family HTH domain